MSRPVAVIRRATRNGAIRSGPPPGGRTRRPTVAGDRRSAHRQRRAGRAPAHGQQGEVAVGVEGHDGAVEAPCRRRGSTVGLVLARDDVGVGGDQAVGDHEAGAVLDPVAGRPLDLHHRAGDRAAAVADDRPVAAGGGPSSGVGPQGVEDLGEVVGPDQRLQRLRWRPAGRGSGRVDLLGDPRGAWPAGPTQPGWRPARAGRATPPRRGRPDRPRRRPRRSVVPSTPSARRGRRRPPTRNPRAWPSDAPTEEQADGQRRGPAAWLGGLAAGRGTAAAGARRRRGRRASPTQDDDPGDEAEAVAADDGEHGEPGRRRRTRSSVERRRPSTRPGALAVGVTRRAGGRG